MPVASTSSRFFPAICEEEIREGLTDNETDISFFFLYHLSASLFFLFSGMTGYSLRSGESFSFLSFSFFYSKINSIPYSSILYVVEKYIKLNKKKNVDLRLP